MPDQFVNHYEVLRVARNASRQQIEKAYTKYLAQAKADEKGDPGDAMIRSGMTEIDVTQLFLARIAQLHQSYQVLSNPDLREEYDEAYDAEMLVRTLHDWDEVAIRPKPGRPAPQVSAEKAKTHPEIGWPAYALERPIWALVAIIFGLLLYGKVNGVITMPILAIREMYPGGALMFLACLLITSGAAKWTVHQIRLKKDTHQVLVMLFGLSAAMTVAWTQRIPPPFDVTSTVAISLTAPVMTFLLFEQRVKKRAAKEVKARHLLFDFAVFMFAAMLVEDITPYAPLAAWMSNWAFIAFLFRL